MYTFFFDEYDEIQNNKIYGIINLKRDKSGTVETRFSRHSID